MSTFSSAVDTPIQITRDTDYFYVLPCSEGLESIEAEGSNFDVEVETLGRAAKLRVNYTGAISGGQEYHELNLSVTFNDSETPQEQTLLFQVFPDSTVIPNIINASLLHYNPGQIANFKVLRDPSLTGIPGAEDLPNWLTLSTTDYVITGTAPTTGERTISKLTATVDNVTFKRYIVFVVGDGGDGGGGGGNVFTGVPHA